MIKSRIAVAGALLAMAGAAGAAGLTLTPTLVSDYDWRGISQTNPDLDGGIFSGPALQLGANYGFENGLYVGAWGSNVDFSQGSGGPSVELDVFGGWMGGDSKDGIGYDVGINTYNYFSHPAGGNFWELYAGISHGMFSGKLWYANEFAASKDSAYYIEGNVTYPLPSNFSVTGHVGFNAGTGVKDYYGDTYIDYSIGVGYTVGKFSLAAKYVNTNITGYKDDKVVLSVSTTWPWAE